MSANVYKTGILRLGDIGILNVTEFTITDTNNTVVVTSQDSGGFTERMRGLADASGSFKAFYDSNFTANPRSVATIKPGDSGDLFISVDDGGPETDPPKRIIIDSVECTGAVGNAVTFDVRWSMAGGPV